MKLDDGTYFAILLCTAVNSNDLGSGLVTCCIVLLELSFHHGVILNVSWLVDSTLEGTS